MRNSVFSSRGEHNHQTNKDAVDIVKQMALRYPDDIIASILNRLGFTTGNTWKKHLVCSLRSKLDLPTYDPNRAQAEDTLTAEQAAARLGLSMRTVRELLRTNVLRGTRVIKFVPWQIPVEALNDSAVSAPRATPKTHATASTLRIDEWLADHGLEVVKRSLFCRPIKSDQAGQLPLTTHHQSMLTDHAHFRFDSPRPDGRANSAGGVCANSASSGTAPEFFTKKLWTK